jgi:hypothetical protein
MTPLVQFYAQTNKVAVEARLALGNDPLSLDAYNRGYWLGRAHATEGLMRWLRKQAVASGRARPVARKAAKPAPRRKG